MPLQRHFSERLRKSCAAARPRELVLSIKMLLTFSDQRMTFLLGMLNGCSLIILSKAGSYAQAGHQENQRANNSHLDAATLGRTMNIYFVIMPTLVI